MLLNCDTLGLPAMKADTLPTSQILEDSAQNPGLVSYTLLRHTI